MGSFFESTLREVSTSGSNRERPSNGTILHPIRFRNSRPPHIALIVDNPFRDLPGLILVAWKLCQADVVCHLVPMNLLAREIWGLRPDLVLINYLRINNQKVVRHLMNAGFPVIVHDTEGGVFSGITQEANTSSYRRENEMVFEEYGLTMASETETRMRINRLCAWSKPFADFAIAKGWYRAEQVAVTGTPRIDFYALPWIEVAAKIAAREYRDFQDPIVLINGSFPLANPRFQSRTAEVEVLTKHFNFSHAFVQKWQDTQQTAMEGLVGLANRLAKNFPNTTFILRPHPFEGSEFYKRTVAALPNLHVVKKGTVDGWLLRAKALIHWSSSTATEACLAGVPALTPGWLPVHLPVPDQDAVSINCATANELEQSLREILSSRFAVPREVEQAVNRSIDRVFFKCDGRSHERVADIILKALSARKRRSIIEWIGYVMHGFTVPGAYFWRENAKRWLQKLRGRCPEPWHLSDKFFDAGIVNTYLAEINQIGAGGERRPVAACVARECGAYRLPGMSGSSVTVARVTPEQLEPF